jgi:WD40 repeat protein
MLWDVSKTYPLYTLAAHGSQINALTLINDKYLASASNDKTIKLWSLISYSMINSWTASTSNVLTLAYDSSLNVLASGDSANQVKIWSSSLLTSVLVSSGIANRFLIILQMNLNLLEKIERNISKMRY